MFSPSVSSTRDPNLRQAQLVVKMMHTTLDERDEEIRLLKKELREGRTSAVRKEIEFLTGHETYLRGELSQTVRDLKSKKRQLEELNTVQEDGYAMRRGSVSAGDLETALGTSIRSVAQKKAKTAKSADVEDSVASPMHVMEGDVFENALEDHGQGGQLDYEVDYDDDDDEEGSKFEVEEEGYLEDEDMVSGDEEKEEVVKVVVKEKEQLQKKLGPLYQVCNEYEPNAMFVITKSQNKNTVVFKANVGGQGQVNSSEPCVPFWVMFNSSPGAGGKHPTEDLNMIEKNTAYGIKYDRQAQGVPGQFDCSVASLSDRIFTVKKTEQGKWVAKSTVSGNNNCCLSRIHVKMADSWIPKVAHVDIYGVDLDSGELVHEKKVP
ncbi:hypothetical protein TL16_g07152 [Triparma laevis f. inornata]|uniref:DUF4833 domain-containing protein n=1 Tax=Triparma laevis f. inornata TaxID=1714386 RepID=A0A9W7AU41_9STRA|nr:hypothetical protein TL16_g07152 [Triparma laevis f. inornata]